MSGRASFTYKYDVYISFRGGDTRQGIISHLTDALTQRGIKIFMDTMLAKEYNVSSIIKAIEESRIVIIIFSENYAFSKWCLEELTATIDCYENKKMNGRMVLPVFYEVEPSDVRHVRGSYGNALARHEEESINFNKDGIETVRKWKIALYKAANITGFHFRRGEDESKFIKTVVEEVYRKSRGEDESKFIKTVVEEVYRKSRGEDESKFIKTVVEEVYRKSTRGHLYIANYPVGLESRMEKVNSLLNLGSDDDVVYMIGIWGTGGIGKTTIAKAVYNSISDMFDGLCFLNDVRQNSMKYGLAHLQQTVLSELWGDVYSKANLGVSTIKRRLHSKKVLLVLDDVDKMEQLEAIVGELDWFGPGSRVIITTRDKHLLKSHAVERIYEVERLHEKESLDLFSWNAFKTDKVDPSYADISKRVLTLASGLPLALQVVGSNLFDRNIHEWRSALDRYERVPEKHIQTVLKISFDSLEEEEQRIFLDIACFFNGHTLESVEDILSALYGASVKYSIEELIEKSLIKIDDGFVTLHNLIQDMGREIVRQESPHEPGKRSRLWLPRDVVYVLEENSGSSTVESLFLDFPKDEVDSNRFRDKNVCWDGESFKKMQNLRTLVIKSGSFDKSPKHLPNSLKVLKWQRYPSPSLPKDFHPKKLSILELPASCMAVIEPIQRFISLKVLNFSNCQQITRIPDVSGLPNLENLSFRGCAKLTKIHESVGFLDKLTNLDAFHCKNLKTFPPIILTSLQQLNLSHCPVLENFPEILGKMENLTELQIIGSPIKELPFSIQNLNRLRKLELQICGMVQLPSSIAMFSQLGLMCVSRCEGLWLSKQNTGEEWETNSSKTERVILTYCNISDDFFPVGLTWFANVKDLDLSGNNFTILHACIKECQFLRNLKLDDCVLLQEITVIPWKLETLSAKRCKSLKYMDLTEECHSLRKLILDDCSNLREIEGVQPNLDHFSAKNCTSLTSQCASMLVNQEMIEAGNKMFSLPGTKIPDWFAHCTNGESISFWFCHKFPAISLCLVIGQVDELPISVKFSPKVFINGKELSSCNQKVFKFRIATDHILLFDARLLKFEDNEDSVFSDNEWNHVEVSYEDLISVNEDLIIERILFPIRGVAKYSGIHVFNTMDGMGDIQFTDPRQTLVDAKLDRNSMEDQTLVMYPTRTSKQSQTPPSEAEKVLVPQSTFPVKRPLGDMGRETSTSISDDEAFAAVIQSDTPLGQRCSEGDDVELEVVSCEEESFSDTECSDSDDPFDKVNRKLCVSGKTTISSGATGDANLRSIREAINALELMMVNDLSEVSDNPVAHSKLHQLLDLLSASSHPKMTVEVKEAIVEFKRKAFTSFREFQATVESVNKLKNYEYHLVRIQHEAVAGKDQRKDVKKSIKRVSLDIKAENSRKNELESEIATLRKHLATKERVLEQIVLNLKNQETKLSTCSTSYASLNERARALSEEVDDLLAESSGIKHDGEAAEIEQSRLKWTWSIDLTGQLNKMKRNILGFYE